MRSNGRLGTARTAKANQIMVYSLRKFVSKVETLKADPKPTGEKISDNAIPIKVFIIRGRREAAKREVFLW